MLNIKAPATVNSFSCPREPGTVTIRPRADRRELEPHKTLFPFGAIYKRHNQSIFNATTFLALNPWTLQTEIPVFNARITPRLISVARVEAGQSAVRETGDQHTEPKATRVNVTNLAKARRRRRWLPTATFTRKPLIYPEAAGSGWRNRDSPRH